MKTGRDTGYRNGVHKTKTNFQTSVFYAVLIRCQQYLKKISSIFKVTFAVTLLLHKYLKATLAINSTVK